MRNRLSFIDIESSWYLTVTVRWTEAKIYFNKSILLVDKSRFTVLQVYRIVLVSCWPRKLQSYGWFELSNFCSALLHTEDWPSVQRIRTKCPLSFLSTDVAWCAEFHSPTTECFAQDDSIFDFLWLHWTWGPCLSGAGATQWVGGGGWWVLREVMHFI